MFRNVIVCCDGTANEFGRDRTNVVKLFSTLVKDPDRQICFYHPGLGTMAAPGFVTRKGAKLAELMGLAFGYGLKSDICDAYAFICDNHRPSDRLFLFGFSRGAYTVRALASLLYMYGLVPADNDRLGPYITRMMWAIRDMRKRHSGATDAATSRYFDLAREFKADMSSECKPHFVGIWDTVSSVGWFANPLSLPYTATNADIAHGRHAVAIDERRAFFRTNLWQPSAQDLKQVWFPGGHGDVGGGYPEAESGAAKIALEWMLAEAIDQGLLVEDERMAFILGRRGGGMVAPDPEAPLHETLRGWWKLLEYVPKPHYGASRHWRANLGRRRGFPARPVVHDSAWTRDNGAYRTRLPPDAVKLSEATF